MPKLIRVFLVSVLALTALACNTVTGLLDEFRTPVVLPGMETETVQPSEEPATEEPGEPTPTFVAPENPNPGAEGIGDPYFEGLGNGGYEVAHYDLALDVNVASDHVSGVATITAVSLQDLSSFNLELAGMTVQSVSVNGEPALFDRDEQELTIFPSLPLRAGDIFEVVVEYRGNPGEGINAYGMDYSEGWLNYGDGIMVAGEPIGASTWFPVNEHPLDKATYSYAITVSDTFDVAANGVLQRIEDNGDSSTHYWNMDQPIAPYLTTIGIARFDVEESTSPSGVAIRNYFGEGVSEDIRADFDKQGEMIAYFETVFGPYPFDAYGVLVHDQDLYFALETATMVVFGKSFTDEYVVSHELAHMWFGDSVGLTAWQDIWLNEGFASYASVLWDEHEYGRDVMDEQLSYVYQQLAEFDDFIPDLPVADPGADDLFNQLVYERGKLTLHALRLEIGDDAFFDTLRAYAERYAHSNASTADFIAIAEEMAGRQLDAFFDAWLYETDLPDIPQMDLSADDFQ